MDHRLEHMGNKIRALRENSGFTQSNLAVCLQVDQSLISMVEKGKRALTSDQLERLAALFGVPISFFQEDNMKNVPLTFAFRAKEMTEADMEAIIAINRIALNSKFMTELFKRSKTDG